MRLYISAVAAVPSSAAGLAAPELQLPRLASLALIDIAVLCFGWFIVEEIRVIRAHFLGLMIANARYR